MNCMSAIAAAPAVAVTADAVAWADLAAVAAEPAPAATAEWLLPAASLLPEGERPFACAVTGAAEDGEGTRLLAMAGLRLSSRLAPLGRLATSGWGRFHFSGAPLLPTGREEEALSALLEKAAAAGAHGLELSSILHDGPVMQAALSVARARGLPHACLAAWRRAALDATRSADDWWQNDISKHRRKEWRRLKRRLAEQGRLSFSSMRPCEPLQPWLDGFLSLEVEGWKGRAGTAIACDPALRRFVCAVARAFAERGNLRFWRLALDGEPVATLFAFVIGRRLWLGKMAYAESLARFSPGVLLMVEATRDILAEGGIGWADSCAVPDHPMIDHIWRQRQAMADVMIATPLASARRARAMIAAEQARRALRVRLKQAWHRLR